MGGNALKIYGFESRRASAAEYDSLVSELTGLLRTMFADVAPVLAYRSKPDHGDIDFACLTTPRGDHTDLKSVVGANFVHKNGSVTSFDYKGIQVDADVKGTRDAFETKLNFCHYSPFGNVFGRIIKQTGVKFGEDGLTYPVKLSDTEQLGCVDLCKDMDRILAFGGLNPAIWRAGFETQRDLFDYCASSALFNKEVFLEVTNHASRKRERIRKDFSAWIDFISGPDAPPARHPWDTDKMGSRAAWLPLVAEAFPEANLLERVEEMKARHAEEKAISAKFNGTHVVEWTSLRGKDLSFALSAFKKTFGDEEDYKAWVRAASPEEIKVRFLGSLSEQGGQVALPLPATAAELVASDGRSL